VCLQDPVAPIRVVPKRLCPLHPWLKSNFHREGAKNAKKAARELVQFLFPSRSWRLRGERFNLLDLLLARGLVLVRVALAHVLAPGGSAPIFTAKALSGRR
jgi:hypothetical protein